MKIKRLIMICLIVACSLSACGKAEVGMANPWIESDRQGVIDATGIELLSPEGASGVYYQYMEPEKMAELSYQTEGTQWVLRAQSASELLDISGMYYEWSLEEDGTVAGMEAKYYSYVSEDEADVMVVNWYDEVSGITYSLSASDDELNGMDIQAYAENAFSAVRNDSDGNGAA